MEMEERKCAWCKSDISHMRSGTKFCCNKCYYKFLRKTDHERVKRINREYDRKRSSRIRKLDISTTTIGSISEYTAAVDLSLRGYEVFKNISHTGSCDLLVLGDKAGPLRVEVTTARGIQENSVYIHKKRYIDTLKYDILAIVDLFGGIQYSSQAFKVNPYVWEIRDRNAVDHAIKSFATQIVLNQVKNSDVAQIVEHTFCRGDIEDSISSIGTVNSVYMFTLN